MTIGDEQRVFLGIPAGIGNRASGYVDAGYIQPALSQTTGIQARSAAQIQHMHPGIKFEGVHDPIHRLVNRIWFPAGHIGFGVQMGRQHLG